MVHIHTPLKARSFTFKNRMSYPPICIGKASEEGAVTQEILDYYDEKTKGGYFSLAIVEHCFITQEGKASQGQISIAEDQMIEGLAKLVQVVQKNGTPIVAQLNHAGSCSDTEITGSELLGPSAIKNPRKGGTPKAMTEASIKDVIKQFVDAAGRAQSAGFDGVEIHSAHSYLLNQFYSPLTNQRTDQYGGSIENRVKLHLEIISAVREKVGDDYPIFLRLGACDHMDGGNQIEDAVKAAKFFEDAGVDVLDISGGMCGYVNPEDDGPGYFGAEGKAVKEAVRIPVIVTGGVKKPEDIGRLLEAGIGDVIGVGRCVMADSSWAKGAMEFYTE